MSYYCRILLLCFFTCAWIRAADGGFQISAHNPWVDDAGFTPIIVRIKSPYDTVVRVRIDNPETSLAQALAVQANSETITTMFLPPLANDSFYAHELMWESDNGYGDKTNISRVMYSTTQELVAVLIDPNEQIRLNELNKLYSASKGSSSSREIIKRAAPDELPDRWQAYPTWLVVLLTPLGDSQLTASQRQAIQQWSQLGGQLFVTNEALQNTWRLAGARAQYLSSTSEAVPLFSRALTQGESRKNWRGIEHTVPGLETVPVKSFICLAVGFALLVGPLNLWWVRRRNARHLLLITTPLFSFVTCIGLIVITLFSDGIATKRSAVQFTVLDQTRHSLNAV
jgi:hypothetical protein